MGLATDLCTGFAGVTMLAMIGIGLGVLLIQGDIWQRTGVPSVLRACPKCMCLLCSSAPQVGCMLYGQGGGLQ